MESAQFLVVLGGLSLIVSMILLGLLIPKLDRDITSLGKVLKAYERKREYLIQDERGYQVWDAKGVIVRDTITILEALNKAMKRPDIEEVIKGRQKNLEVIMLSMLLCISQKLDYSDKDFKSWKSYGYEELNSKKLECFKRWKKIFGETLVSINSIEELIRSTDFNRKNVMYSTIFFQVYGTFLTLLSKM